MARQTHSLYRDEPRSFRARTDTYNEPFATHLITERQLQCLAWVQEGKSAREELVAELGAAFLCADLGLELEPRPDHASYVASWLQVLKDDRRFIFTAAAHAQRAADFMHLRQAD